MAKEPLQCFAGHPATYRLKKKLKNQLGLHAKLEKHKVGVKKKFEKTAWVMAKT